MGNTKEPDVVIIGGGICGTSTAFHLAQLGEKVTILERGELASESSGVNAGGVGGYGWGNIPDLQSYLTAGSFEIFKSLQLDMGYDIEFHAQGGLQAIHTQDQWEYARDKVFHSQSNGYSLELITTREARAVEPEISDSLPGVMFLPKRGRANPIKATLAFGRAASELKSVIKTNHEVQNISQRPDYSWHVRTNQGNLTCATVVLAAGAWSQALGNTLGIDIPIIPIRGQMWATQPVPPHIFHLSGSVESHFDWSHQIVKHNRPPELTHIGNKRTTRHLYGGQTRNGEIIFGGDRQMAGYSYVPEAEGIEINRAHASEVFPFISRLSIKRTWAGIMPFSIDGKPIIGQIPQFKNLFIVTGLGSSGFGRGPMAGKLLADYIHTGHPHPVLADSDPARCVVLR